MNYEKRIKAFVQKKLGQQVKPKELLWEAIEAELCDLDGHLLPPEAERINWPDTLLTQLAAIDEEHMVYFLTDTGNERVYLMGLLKANELMAFEIGE